MSTKNQFHFIKGRRDFLQNMGRVGLALSPTLLIPGCLRRDHQSTQGALPENGLVPSPSDIYKSDFYRIPSIAPSLKDDLVLAEGVVANIVITEGAPINQRGDLFGTNNDYIAMIPVDDKDPSDCLIWINHESPSLSYLYGTSIDSRTDEAIQLERKWVGGSILRVRNQDGWQVVPDEKWTRRIDGTTIIPFAGGHKIKGRDYAEGTLGNCAGGVTPWKTILTCEENFNNFYGFSQRDKYYKKKKTSKLSWDSFYDNPSEHYGWVVEVDPFTGKAVKHVSLGRFAHETATVVELDDGRVVVYSGDDHVDECLYKFVADKPGSLETGTLYVANVEKGRWLPLDIEKDDRLRKEFDNQLDVLTYARNSAELVRGTPLDRPEDIAIDPGSGAVIVALSNNRPAGRPFGSLLRLEEKNGYDGLEFEAKTLVSGGSESGFICPDNLCFDGNENLWMTTDLSSNLVGEGIYSQFGNNGLFVLPMNGENKGRSFQIASAPVDAELTGITVAPDQSALFVCVQHPGDLSFVTEEWTSHWPTSSSQPVSAVVALTGPTIENLIRPS